MGVATEFPSVHVKSQKYFAWSWALGLKKEIDELDGIQRRQTVTSTRYYKDKRKFVSTE